jgi:hypothetical protein
MLLDCETKGCRQKTEAKLNVETNEVICDECGNVISNITRFTKKALKDLGQILRSHSKQPFQALCKTCNASRQLFIEDEKAYCKKCNTQVHVTAAFLRGLKFHLEDKEKEE